MTNERYRLKVSSYSSLNRTSDYCLSYDDDSVFIDYIHCCNEQVRLLSISFDGYGCCWLERTSIPLAIDKSLVFKEQVAAGITDQELMLFLVKESIFLNREQLWIDALQEYALI
jgi:hypothetical protein